RRRSKPLQAACSFKHNQGGVEWLQPFHECHNATGIVRHGPTLSRGAQRNIELGFRHINAHKAWLITHEELLSARPCTYGLSGTKHLYGLAAVQDVTTHAPLRSQQTKAISVYHAQGLGDGDSPTSPTKDTRRFAVACKPLSRNA